MLKNKKSQGLPINVIVIAVIGLIVLGVVIGIFSGKFGDFTSGVESIGNPAETCLEQSSPGATTNLRDDNCESDEVSILSRDTVGKGKKCCIVSSSDDDSDDEPIVSGPCCSVCRDQLQECRDDCEGDTICELELECDSDYFYCSKDCDDTC